jgi:hypothetical protein
MDDEKASKGISNNLAVFEELSYYDFNNLIIKINKKMWMPCADAHFTPVVVWP